MTLRIPITSRDQWLARRKFDVTASVVGAVFGCHPYVTPLHLYVEKQGLVDLPERGDGGVLRRGRIYEPAVAAAVAEQRPDWQLEKCRDYFCDEATGIGASPKPSGPMQIRTWPLPGDTILLAPAGLAVDPTLNPVAIAAPWLQCT